MRICSAGPRNLTPVHRFRRDFEVHLEFFRRKKNETREPWEKLFYCANRGFFGRFQSSKNLKKIILGGFLLAPLAEKWCPALYIYSCGQSPSEHRNNQVIDSLKVLCPPRQVSNNILQCLSLTLSDRKVSFLCISTTPPMKSVSYICPTIPSNARIPSKC